MAVAILDTPVVRTSGLNFTPTAGASHALIWVTQRNSSGTASAATGVTLGGQSMTLIAGYNSGTKQRSAAGLWCLNAAGIAAMSGNAIVVSGGSGTRVVVSASISGAAQAYPTGGDVGTVDPVDSIAATLNRSITLNRYAGGLTFAVQHWNIVSTPVTMTNPSRDGNNSDAGSTQSYAYEPDASTASVAVSWSNANTTAYASFLAASFQPTATAIVNSVNGGTDTVAIGQSSTWVTSNFSPDANAATVDGVSCSSVSVSGFTVPSLVDESTIPRPGSRSLVGSNGSQSDDLPVTVTAPAGWLNTVLAGTLNTTNTGCLYALSPAAVADDQIIYLDAYDNIVYPNGDFATNLYGTQQFWHLQDSTKIARVYDVTTNVDGTFTVTKALTARKFTASAIVARKISARGLL